MPGIGPVLSAVLLAGLPELGTLDRRAIAALAGVAPHPHDRGDSQGQRHIGGGRPADSRALYQMAVTAVRSNALMQTHDAQLHLRRPRKVALIAWARRMLGILTAMLRDGLTWQDTRVGQGPFLPNTA